MQALQALGVAGRHKGRVGDEVHQQFNAGLAVKCTGAVGAVGIELLDLLGRGTKGIDILVAHELGNLHVGTVERAQG